MPSRVLTKRRVNNRRRLVSKNAKRKGRAVRTLRKQRKSVKKVMRGVVDLGDYEVDYIPDFSIKKSRGNAYVLYDKIPSGIIDEKQERTNNSRLNSNPYINVPICVIFIVSNTPLDDIYLVFNKNITAEDITLIAKLLLGIDAATEFNLTPLITIPNTTTQAGNTNTLGRLLGNTFVKICGCGLGRGGTFTYCIESGTFDSETELDKVTTTRHKITTSDEKYKSLNGTKIKASLTDGGFKNRVLTTKAVLAELYKKYFIQVTEEIPGEVTEEELEKHFGNDREQPDRKSLNNNVEETYADFKKG